MATSLVGSYDQVTFALRTQMRALIILQEQAATGSRINRVSDDPSAAREILAIDSQTRSMENWFLAIDDISDSLSICSTAIDSIANSLAEVERVMTQAVSGLLSESQRQLTAGEIDELLQEIVALANTQRMGHYIFAGSATGSPAYTVERSGGKITSVTYTGSSEARNVEVAPGVQASGVMVGQTAFGGCSTAQPVFPTDGTGVSAGTGTSTATGMIWLDVVRDGTDYKLSIDGGLSYITADGSANQAVTDSRTGKVFYVNTSAITHEGTDLVQMSGTADVFSTLIGLRDALLSGDAAKISQLQARAAEVIDEVQQYVVKSSVLAGSKINGLTSLKDGLQRISDTAVDRTAQLQDADVAQVAIDLSKYQLLYEMSMSVAAKTLSKSLLDYIE